MVLDGASAALLAQVFPTLLIALLVEGKFTKRESRRKWILKSLMVVRLAAVLAAVGATFLCLIVVVTGRSSIFIDSWTLFTVIVLFLAVLVMCVEIFDREVLEHTR